MMLGGIRFAIVDAEAMSAAVNARSYPSLAMSCAMVRLNTATSATDEHPHVSDRQNQDRHQHQDRRRAHIGTPTLAAGAAALPPEAACSARPWGGPAALI